MARQMMAAQRAPELVLVLDGIDAVFDWREAVKCEWDTDDRNEVNIKVLITQTSQKAGLGMVVESMMGRFEEIRMSRWTFPEMRAAFDWSFAKYLWFGGYPWAAGLVRDEAAWREAVQAVLRKSMAQDMAENLTASGKKQLFDAFTGLAAQAGRAVVPPYWAPQLLSLPAGMDMSDFFWAAADCALLRIAPKFNGTFLGRRLKRPDIEVFDAALRTAFQPEGFAVAHANRRRWREAERAALGAALVSYAWKMRRSIFAGTGPVDFVISMPGGRVAVRLPEPKETEADAEAYCRKFNIKKLVTLGEKGLTPEAFLASDIMAPLLPDSD